MTHQPQRVELLAPAGNFEKLETAIHYGADAVYLGGKAFSLRNFSGNFTLDEMKSAVDLARKQGVRVYVTCNIYPRNHDLQPLTKFLDALGKIGPDGIIIADPGILQLARKIIPQIPIHLSTQANTTNLESVRFWHQMGVRRINLARELSLEEIRQIAIGSEVETEVFVHGAMCMAYSGRCLLSSFLTHRESNRGMCSQPCRFRYALVEEKRPGSPFPLQEDAHGAYILNSKDLCMIQHLDALISTGINALKIEGRMKGIHYVATAVKVYREAIDAYYATPGKFKIDPRWTEELAKITHRGYCTGFYFDEPDQSRMNYSQHANVPGFVLAAKVLDIPRDGQARIDVRNRISVGDLAEVMTRKGPTRKATVLALEDETGQHRDIAQPGTVVIAHLDTQCLPNDLIRIWPQRDTPK